MRKSILFYSFLCFIIAGMMFTTQAQDSNGKAPQIVESNSSNWTSEPTSTDATVGYAHSTSNSQLVSLPLPGGTPLTIIGPQAYTDFAGGGCFGGDGNFYVCTVGDASGTPQLWIQSITTGAATLVGGTGLSAAEGFNGIAFDHTSGVYYGASGINLYTFDHTTGAATLVGPLNNTGGLLIDLAIDCLGNMYMHDLGLDAIFSVDKGTGAATLIGSTGFDANFGQGMGYDHDAGVLYLFAFNNVSFTAQLMTVNVTTGLATMVADYGLDQHTAFDGQAGCGGTLTLTIAEAREDLDLDFIPDRLGDTVTVAGTISSPNYNTGNFNYVIHDGTAGVTSIFFGYTGPEYIMGDVVQITGVISQYSGLTQIEPLDDASVVLTGTGGTLPDYTVLTISQFLASAEMYEGELIAFVSLSGEGGGDPWPSSGSNANFNLTDIIGADILVMRIDKETDLDDNPEPVWPKDVIGFGGQFSTATPPNDGYQLLARMYSEILPPGTVPVELTSFSAQVSSRVVTLNWTTATELNNQMFEIERRSEDGQYIRIGYVDGHGTTTEAHEYSYIDNTVEIGTFFYRLKQIDFGGRYAYSDVVQVDVVAPTNFSLEQNYPNPFNPSTKITFSLAVNSKVSLKVFDVLGQEVTNLVTSNMTAGVHEINFNAVNLNSGVYFYRLDATGVDGTNFTSVKKMLLTK